jgi:transcriptional regulator with XRE-family HTH domain
MPGKLSTVKPNEKIRSAMVLSGYTQEALAKSIGISYSAFSLKLNGKREFTISECQRIARKLGTSLDALFFNCDVPKREQLASGQ